MSEKESLRETPQNFDVEEDIFRPPTSPEFVEMREMLYNLNPAHKPSSKMSHEAAKSMHERIAKAINQESKARVSEIRRATEKSIRDQKDNVPSFNRIREDPRATFPTTPTEQSSVYTFPTPTQQSSVYDTATDQPAVPLPPLPPDWISHRDETSGNIYYIHIPTQAVQWDFPSPGSMPNQSLPAPNYGVDGSYTGYPAQDPSPSLFQSSNAIVDHDDPVLDEAIKVSLDSFYSQPKVSEPTKLRGSKIKASKSSGKGSSTASEIGSDKSSASKKAKESNQSPLLTFLAGGRKR